MKETIWKYFGAMMLEDKGGKQAMSWTRGLGLLVFTVWLICMVLQAFQLWGVQTPWELTAGMASFAGIKGMKDFGTALKK